MRSQLLALAAELTRRGEAFAVATVIRREAPSSARVGDSALVTATGAFYGWLGGSCTRSTAVRESLAAIRTGTARTIALRPDPDAESRPYVSPVRISCQSGGSVDLYIEPFLPAPRLVVFGVTPTALAALRIGKVLGYATAAVDPEAEAASLPDVDCVGPDLEAIQTSGFPRGDTSPLFAIVATLGERDEDALRAALALDPVYLGLVASRKRFQQVRDALSRRGLPAAQLDRLRSPAGLDIGAVAPEEIALSILAEIVQVARARGARSDAPREFLAAESVGMAVDPICQMIVDPRTTKHRAEVAGRTYYFCCGGCRERFLAGQAPSATRPAPSSRA
jgi:xanthine dehydrogenase accessory factor